MSHTQRPILNAQLAKNLQILAIGPRLDRLGRRQYHARVILIVDNYDSFTYNLVQRIGELGRADEIRVIRNDVMPPAQAESEIRPQHLIISPGPCTPNEAGLSCEYITHFHGKVPILGVCLGHQCIVAAYGGTIERADRVMHGKVSNIYHDGKTIYDSLSNPFSATRYHSLIVHEQNLPDALQVSAYTSEGEIMGVRLADRRIEGVQFHPESILTPEGKGLLANYLQTVRPHEEQP